MPEGDSIHKLARRLAPLFVGKNILTMSMRGMSEEATQAMQGRRIVSVDARGKNLLVAFDNERVLHVHLRMQGRIRIVAGHASDALRASRRLPSQLELRVEGATMIGRRIAVLRLLRASDADRQLATLGPDLLGPSFSESDAIARLRRVGAMPIGEALMLQQLVAGIGNVYKSEILFLERVDPTVPTTALDDLALARLLTRARQLMQQNLGRGLRTTRRALAGPRAWVYGRANEPCLVCGGRIRRIYQGPRPGRSTYHCPTCQTSSFA